MVLYLISHVVFISVYDESVCSNFIDSYAAVQLSQHHLQSLEEKPERISSDSLLDVSSLSLLNIMFPQSSVSNLFSFHLVHFRSHPLLY